MKSSADVEMPEGAPTREWRSSLWLPITGIALATPFLAWFAVGDSSTGASPGWGPYDVGPSSGYLVPGVAGVVALVALGVLVVRTRQGIAHRWWWAIALTLAGAGSVGAYGWRLATAGVSGGELGTGLVLFLGPPLIAGLLVVTVWLAFIADQVSASDQSGAERRHRLQRAWLLTMAAVLVAPALYSLVYYL